MTRARMPRPHEVAAARRDPRLLRAVARAATGRRVAHPRRLPERRSGDVLSGAERAGRRRGRAVPHAVTCRAPAWPGRWRSATATASGAAPRRASAGPCWSPGAARCEPDPDAVDDAGPPVRDRLLDAGAAELTGGAGPHAGAASGRRGSVRPVHRRRRRDRRPPRGAGADRHRADRPGSPTGRPAARPARARPRRGRRRGRARPGRGARRRGRGRRGGGPGDPALPGRRPPRAGTGRRTSTRPGRRCWPRCADAARRRCRWWSAAGPAAPGWPAARPRAVGAVGVLALAFPLHPPGPAGALAGPTSCDTGAADAGGQRRPGPVRRARAGAGGRGGGPPGRAARPAPGSGRRGRPWSRLAARARLGAADRRAGVDRRDRRPGARSLQRDRRRRPIGVRTSLPGPSWSRRVGAAERRDRDRGGRPECAVAVRALRPADDVSARRVTGADRTRSRGTARAATRRQLERLLDGPEWPATAGPCPARRRRARAHRPDVSLRGGPYAYPRRDSIRREGMCG